LSLRAQAKQSLPSASLLSLRAQAKQSLPSSLLEGTVAFFLFNFKEARYEH
jgi:hypothetical protein